MFYKIRFTLRTHRQYLKAPFLGAFKNWRKRDDSSMCEAYMSGAKVLALERAEDYKFESVTRVTPVHKNKFVYTSLFMFLFYLFPSKFISTKMAVASSIFEFWFQKIQFFYNICRTKIKVIFHIFIYFF